jgi:ABC-2 type transport system ATP-binding protein
MNNESNFIVEVRSVHKSFKDVHAVKGVDLAINHGEFVALLGPNGAGKTTLVEMIEGIQFPDSGEIFIDNKLWKHHQHELHQIIGLSLQETRFIEKLTTIETMQLFASFYKLNSGRVNEVIELVGLGEKRKAFVNNLSGGQRQRLALGVALLNQPRLLLLDEPTTGLDPNARREIWQILLQLKKEFNTSLILTSHYMEEAEFLCDRIIIMDNGVILSQGTLQEILDINGGSKNLDELFINMTGRHLYE